MISTSAPYKSCRKRARTGKLIDESSTNVSCFICRGANSSVDPALSVVVCLGQFFVLQDDNFQRILSFTSLGIVPWIIMASQQTFVQEHENNLP